LKHLLILLTLLAFIAGPLSLATGAQAASQSNSSSSKSQASSAKSKNVSAKNKKTKKKSAAKKKTSKSVKKSGAKATRVSLAPPVEPALRAMRGVGAETLLGEELALNSSAALVFDQATGAALYAKNIDVPTSIASITKLMTAMVTLDADLSMDEEIQVSKDDVDRLKGTGSRIALGTRLTREELLHLALIASENRAAAALSRAYPGGRSAFITAMNRKAREIGMHDSRFVDSTGLDSGNRATAVDLAKLVDAAYRYPLIREISTTGSYDVTVPGTRMVRVKENGKVRKVYRSVQKHLAFTNTNSLTRNQEWEIGVSKTGYINEAGHCLVMQTRIADQPVIIVLLDSVGKWGRIGDAQRIRKWLEQDTSVAIHKSAGTST
jgi:serine-type D-Ala-D-Ala endopeptidase (penicillin-binding protein 7)